MNKNKKRIDSKSLIKILEAANDEFMKTQEVLYDALEPALKFKNLKDQEFAAFLCSVLAYGKISQVKINIHQILDPMGENPVDFLIYSDDKTIKLLTHGWKHRFNTSKDIFCFLFILKKIYSKYNTLENFISPSDCNSAEELLTKIYEKFYQEKPKNIKVDKGFQFFIPNPKLNSASKRMNLFLKWMIRTDFPDLGIWKSFDKSKLIIPLDTHVYKQAKSLGWTKRTAADLTTAKEITEELKKLDSKDPTRFDFALCHLSIHGKILGNL